MRRDEGGSAAAFVIVTLPLLIAVVAGVVQLGAVRVLAARVAGAADAATLAAVDDQDETALVGAGVLRLPADAELTARRFFALDLEPIASHLDLAPEVIAARADVVVVPAAQLDPGPNVGRGRPTVHLAAAVPVRTPAFGALLLPAVVVVNVSSVSSPR